MAKDPEPPILDRTPILPTDEEIEAELTEIEEEKQWAGDLWPLSQMRRDIAISDEFMELITVSDFAQQFRLFFLNNDMVHLQSGKMVRTTTDDTGAWILADLRGFGEHWRQCEAGPKEGEDSAARDTIVRLFAEVGYVLSEVEFDEDAYLERLWSVWETMPLKVKREVLGEDGKVQALVLAWAMGEFWSQENGWIIELQGSSAEEIRLRGGHIPDAIKIAQMVKEGLLSKKRT